jgi:hypothetical protein
MQWRRGLAFAAAHLVVAFSIVAAIEFEESAMWRDHYRQFASSAQKSPIAPKPSANSVSDSAPDFSICGMIDETSPRERIIAIADLPAAFLTAWRMPCPPRWTVSGMLIGTTAWGHPTAALLAKQRTVDGILLMFVAVQWLLIGGLPLRPHEKLIRDPATLITACSALAALFSFIPQMDFLAGLFALIAAVTWLYWLALLAWKLLRSATKRVSAARTASG